MPCHNDESPHHLHCSSAGTSITRIFRRAIRAVVAICFFTSVSANAPSVPVGFPLGQEGHPAITRGWSHAESVLSSYPKPRRAIAHLVRFGKPRCLRSFFRAAYGSMQWSNPRLQAARRPFFPRPVPLDSLRAAHLETTLRADSRRDFALICRSIKYTERLVNYRARRSRVSRTSTGSDVW